MLRQASRCLSDLTPACPPTHTPKVLSAAIYLDGVVLQLKRILILLYFMCWSINYSTNHLHRTSLPGPSTDFLPSGQPPVSAHFSTFGNQLVCTKKSLESDNPSKAAFSYTQFLAVGCSGLSCMRGLSVLRCSSIVTFR